MAGVHHSPLNSDDDIDESDDENVGKDFEAEDTIVCQWDKVRGRGRKEGGRPLTLQKWVNAQVSSIQGWPRWSVSTTC